MVTHIQDAMAAVSDRKATLTGTLRVNGSLGAALSEDLLTFYVPIRRLSERDVVDRGPAGEDVATCHIRLREVLIAPH